MSGWIECPACSKRLGRLIRHRRVLETKCPRCGAVVEISIDVAIKEPGHVAMARPPTRRLHKDKPKTEEAKSDERK